MPIFVERLPIALTPDPSRMITRLFFPGDIKRAREIVERASPFPRTRSNDSSVNLNEVSSAGIPISGWSSRSITTGSDSTSGSIGRPASCRLFIGACFTMEYAIESVALCNPSIVPALGQEGVPHGGVRFLMSLRDRRRAHLVDRLPNGRHRCPGGGDVSMLLVPTANRLRATLPELFRKSTLSRNIVALSRAGEKCPTDPGPARRAFHERGALQGDRRGASGIPKSSGLPRIRTADTLVSLTRLNYQLHLVDDPAAQSQSEFVIFPFSDIERQGMEDLRLVRFTENDRSTIDYGTFTAFNGRRGFSQLMEFHGESTIEVSLITGECARNKGMALFPRGMHGKYAMISRIDNESLYYMESDDILAVG